jgi:hypothetical protein
VAEVCEVVGMQLSHSSPTLAISSRRQRLSVNPVSRTFHSGRESPQLASMLKVVGRLRGQERPQGDARPLQDADDQPQEH